MYCPNCGIKISAGQNFCRSCGLGLEKVAQSLAEQLPAKLDEDLQERKNKLERWGVVALGVFGLGLLSFIIIMAVYKLMITQGKVWAGLGLLGLIVVLSCGVLSVILFAKANDVEEVKNKRRLQQPEVLSGEETTVKLLPDQSLEPMPSVTERTNELLFAEKRDGAQGS